MAKPVADAVLGRDLATGWMVTEHVIRRPSLRRRIPSERQTRGLATAGQSVSSHAANSGTKGPDFRASFAPFRIRSFAATNQLCLGKALLLDSLDEHVQRASRMSHNSCVETITAIFGLDIDALATVQRSESFETHLATQRRFSPWPRANTTQRKLFAAPVRDAALESCQRHSKISWVRRVRVRSSARAASRPQRDPTSTPQGAETAPLCAPVHARTKRDCVRRMRAAFRLPQRIDECARWTNFGRHPRVARRSVSTASNALERLALCRRIARAEDGPRGTAA
jgi:hypothetical protein